jgi:hypothetical protein
LSKGDLGGDFSLPITLSDGCLAVSYQGGNVVVDPGMRRAFGFHSALLDAINRAQANSLFERLDVAPCLSIVRLSAHMPVNVGNKAFTVGRGEVPHSAGGRGGSGCLNVELSDDGTVVANPFHYLALSVKVGDGQIEDAVVPGRSLDVLSKPALDTALPHRVSPRLLQIRVAMNEPAGVVEVQITQGDASP